MSLPRFLAIALALLLSGCAGKDRGDGTGPTTGTASASQTVSLDVAMERPDWRLGQYWSYRVEIPGRPTATFKMVVAEDLDDRWIVATDDREKALHHALYSTNPVLGRITKQALSPYQSDQPVNMYEFPLTDRKTWTSAFFGEEMTFTSTYSDTLEAQPGVYLPGFDVRAQGTGSARVDFNYVEAFGWFSDFQVYDPDGKKDFHLILLDAGASYEGPYYFLRGKDLYGDVLTEGTNPTSPTTFNVGEDFHALGVGLVAEATSDSPSAVNLLNVTLKRPDGSAAYQRQWTLARNEQVTDAIELATAKGAWTIEVTLVGSVRVDLRTVGLVVFQGEL